MLQVLRVGMSGDSISMAVVYSEVLLCILGPSDRYPKADCDGLQAQGTAFHLHVRNIPIFSKGIWNHYGKMN